MTIKTEKPLDYSGQVWRGIDDKFPKKIHNATTTSDGLMSAEDKAKLDVIDINDYNRKYDVASWENDGLLSKEDKKKLDSVKVNATNMAEEIIQDEKHRFVTEDQISYWDAKASTDTATQQINGLLSAEDKIKLDSVKMNATNIAEEIIQDETYRFVTDDQIEYWNNKASTDPATHGKDGLLTAADKEKLDSIDYAANKYIHPNNEGIRHVSDAEKDYWNSKADKLLVTNSENGLMAFEDKIKLDGIEPNANNYIHPDDKNTRHVTDEQIKFWDSRGAIDVATHTKNGLMSKEDKKILDKLAIIDPNMEDRHFVTSEEKEYWNSKASTNVATHEMDGLLSKEDKIKLDELTVSHTEEISLSYSNWSDTQPYTQVLNVPGINPTSNAYIGINPNATVEEISAAADAKLKIGLVEQDKITIIANGVKPDTDLPIIIMAGSNIVIFEVNNYNDTTQEYSETIPTTGYHYQNEIIYSSKPVQTKCIGWVCTNSGEPGEWSIFGDINI